MASWSRAAEAGSSSDTVGHLWPGISFCHLSLDRSAVVHEMPGTHGIHTVDRTLATPENMKWGRGLQSGEAALPIDYKAKISQKRPQV